MTQRWRVALRRRTGASWPCGRSRSGCRRGVGGWRRRPCRGCKPSGGGWVEAELEGLAEAQVTPEEDLELARWQCRCLERRLAQAWCVASGCPWGQARSYNGQLLQDGAG